MPNPKSQLLEPQRVLKEAEAIGAESEGVVELDQTHRVGFRGWMRCGRRTCLRPLGRSRVGYCGIFNRPSSALPTRLPACLSSFLLREPV